MTAWRYGLLILTCIGVAAMPRLAVAWPDERVGNSDGAPSEQGTLCRAAVKAAAVGRDLPPNLLMAIALTESGRRDPSTGRVEPWPWSVNVEGQDHVFASKQQAIDYVRGLQAEGVRSVDVGCMQINLMYHPDAFSSLEQAFDPRANAIYAVNFLDELYRESGSWAMATAAYHSKTPELGEEYRKKVALAQSAETNGSDHATMSLALNGASIPRMMAAPALPSLPAGAGSGLWAAHQTYSQRGNPAMVLAALASPRGGSGHDLSYYRSAPVSLAQRPVAQLAKQ